MNICEAAWAASRYFSALLLPSLRELDLLLATVMLNNWVIMSVRPLQTRSHVMFTVTLLVTLIYIYRRTVLLSILSYGGFKIVQVITEFLEHRVRTSSRIRWRPYMASCGWTCNRKSVRTSSTVESSWNVMAHGDTRGEKWRANWQMEWVASTLRTTSKHGVSSITTADAHTSTASSRMNWGPLPI